MRKAKGPGDPRHMDIERDDELRRRDAFPLAEIEPVFSDHPAEKEIEALAGAPALWRGKEEADPGPRGEPSPISVKRPPVKREEISDESAEGGANGRLVFSVPPKEEILQRARQRDGLL